MQTFVTLPVEIQTAILVGITFAVGFVFAKIAEHIPQLSVWLGDNVTSVSVSLAGAVVQFIQGYLNQIPLDWQGVATIALQLLVSVLATLKVFDVLKKRDVKYFRSL